MVLLIVLLALLAVCLLSSWSTRDAMVHLPFMNWQGGSQLHARGKKTLVDISPWQTAQSLAPLAVSAEETEYAREAERLADHDVDQAFASALRLANLHDKDRVLTGQALVISKRIAQLQQLIKQDQALVDGLTAKSASGPAKVKAGAPVPASTDDLEVAKAQLGLDTDELADAQRELERVSGDESVRIQEDLN
ncbi:MAG: mechanosensitive ion channel protein MscS, partial [Acidobacteriota bacterium]